MRTIDLATSIAVLVASGTGLGAQDTLRTAIDMRPAWGDSLRVVEELRIGELEGLPEVTFGRVSSVCLAPDGSIQVFDDGSTIIRRYDREGTYLGDVGRAGGGPGEYFSSLGLKPHPEGCALWDPRNARISLYSWSGVFVRSVRHSSGLFTSDAFQVDTAGHFYIKALRPGQALRPGVEAEMAWVEIDSAGTVLDSIPIPRSARGLVRYTAGGPRYPFTRYLTSAMSPHGYLVTGNNASYAVSRPLNDGRILTIQRPVVRVPLEPQERDEWVEMLDWFRARTGASLPDMPSTKPAFRDLVVDQQGRIWVSRYVRARLMPEDPVPPKDERPSYRWREPPVWDIFDPRGQFLGTIETPEGSLLAASDRVLWVVVRGEYDENYLVRYRIEQVRPR